ncbi:MAG TPA: hypothetical protein VGO01_13575 [Bradyrhizobium sp.]|jgi:hypothetical protein|nr:hypothetical protein [Bradyrhizobium sp.]
MSVEPVITQAEFIRQWLSVLLGPLVTSFGFFFIYRQLAIAANQAKISADQAKTASNNYLLAVESANRATAQAREQQNWKKAEFLANQVKDFYADDIVDHVTRMVDWSTCKIRFDEIERPVLCVQDNIENSMAKNEESLRKEFFDEDRVVIVAQALRLHTDNGQFTELENAVRNEFDWFFFRLGQFQHMIVSKLFSYDEVEVHLDYVLDLFSGGLGDGHVSPDLTKNIDAYMVKYGFTAAKSLIDARIQKRLVTPKPSPAAASPAAAAPP